MIIWKNRKVEDLSPAELRLALEDAADEIVRAQRSFGADQIWTTLFAGFSAGAVLGGLAVTCLRMAT